MLVTLGVLVTFHEFGHYWVARRCGVTVLRFSVGFGQALWKRIGRDGTEYRIAMIPLGGYVKMLDAREGEVDPALYDQEFTRKSVWKRIAIVAAGPAFNVIFTIAAFWVMFMLGRADVAPVVTAVPQTIAASAGIREGDRILSIDGKVVTTLTDSMELVGNAMLSRTPLPLTVRGRDGAERQLVLPLNQLPAGKSVDQYFPALGLKLVPAPAIAAVVKPNQPAVLAGLRGGDRLLSVNGHAVDNFDTFGELIASEAAKSPTLVLGAERNGKPLQFRITARMESLQGQPARWLIGVAPPQPEEAMQHYGPITAMGAALGMTVDRARSMVEGIGMMLSGQASTKNLSSVITIAQVANASASMGVSSFLEFLGWISLSLGILNLLPIPVLDGGHLLYYLIELLKGSPVSEKTMIAGQYIGLLLLFTLMGLAFYNDIHRMILPT